MSGRLRGTFETNLNKKLKYTSIQVKTFIKAVCQGFIFSLDFFKSSTVDPFRLLLVKVIL